MKKVGVCANCEREMYTNELDLCKKCNHEVGMEFLRQQESEETGGTELKGSVVIEAEETSE